MEATFTEIYRENGWGSAESRSGPGSTAERGADFRDDLSTLLRHLQCRILLDAPCGDFNWIAAALTEDIEYIGVDIVRELIETNRARHGGPRRTFMHADLTTDRLPRADVILCRDCLVHFTDAEVWSALRNFRRSGSTLLLATTFTARESNPPITTGAWRPLNLEAPPFRFPPPLEFVDERCLHTNGAYADKRLALWRLADLPEVP